MPHMLFPIKTAGDLEAVFLHETQELLSDLILADEFYDLLGDPPCQVQFRTRGLFHAFLVRLEELLAEATVPRVAGISNRQASLLDLSTWFCFEHADEARACGLTAATETLRDWMATTRDVRYWCPALDTHVTVSLSRREMVWFAANLHKHSLFRIGRLLAKLQKRCSEAGLNLTASELIDVRSPFFTELESRLEYLSTWMIDQLGQVLLALNAVITGRHASRKTSEGRSVELASASSAEPILELYGDALAFMRYPEERIRACLPTTPPLLKMRY